MRQLRASEEDDYRTYYESGLLFIETMSASDKECDILQILEQIKGKYMFKIISYRKLHVHSSKPQQAGHFNKRIYQALSFGDLDEAKRIVYEFIEQMR